MNKICFIELLVGQKNPFLESIMKFCSDHPDHGIVLQYVGYSPESYIKIDHDKQMIFEAILEDNIQNVSDIPESFTDVFCSTGFCNDFFTDICRKGFVCFDDTDTLYVRDHFLPLTKYIVNYLQENNTRTSSNFEEVLRKRQQVKDTCKFLVSQINGRQNGEATQFMEIVSLLLEEN